MSSGIPLFDKINGRRMDFDDDYSVIVLHLNRLLNTRQGSSVCDPDYGIPDLNDLLTGMPRTSFSIAKIFDNCIRKYETRIYLHHVQVIKESETGRMHFEIVASVKGPCTDVNHVLWSMRAFVDGYGYVKVH